jgi:ABC-type multidrug transport system ATPase subunit
VIFDVFTIQETLTDAVNLLIKDQPKSVKLKKGELSVKQKLVQDIMTDLRIINSKDTSVGSFGDKGVSGGEKRRLSLGVELINNPQILFLDEPTSGLDSFTALLVMALIKREAR